MSLLGRLSKLGIGCFRVRPILPRHTVVGKLRHATGASSCPVSVCLLSRYSTESPNTDLSVCYRYGRPVLSVPLPSRGELCQFSIRPMLMTAGCFIRDIQTEDPGADTVTLLNADGNRVSSTTLMDTVLDSDFQLIINGTSYNVHVPGRESHEHVTGLDDMKAVVQMLHAALHMPQHQLTTHTQLLQRLDDLTQKLAPMEKDRARLMSEAGSKASRQSWGVLAYLSLQGGFLAYLTWYVFAWDVMEPITYFLTYTSSMLFFAYYMLTKQDCILPDVRDRQSLHFFYEKAKMDKFDVDKYNQLKDQLATVENDLKRLQRPIRLQLPLEQIQSTT